MTIEQDIADWATSRPPWQQTALRQLAQGHSFDQVRSMRSPHSSRPVQARGHTFAGDEYLRTPSRGYNCAAGSDPRRNQRECVVGSQELTFGAAGLTVIYGDNGSGKSGYARLIKSVVGRAIRSRYIPMYSPILRNGHRKPKSNLAAAVPTSFRNGLMRSMMSFGSISFYDEACGEEYMGRL